MDESRKGAIYHAMKPWQFKLLKWLWGDWGPADLILIASYVGTGMEWSLPLRKALTIRLLGFGMKKWCHRHKGNGHEHERIRDQSRME